MSEVLIGRTTNNQGTVCELYEPTDREVEVFVDGMQGIQVRGPIVKINMYRTVPNHGVSELPEGHEKRVVTSRMVMGIDTFMSVVKWLNESSDSMIAAMPQAETPRH